MNWFLGLLFLSSSVWAESTPKISYRSLGETCVSIFRPMDHEIEITFNRYLPDLTQTHQILRQTKFYAEELVHKYPPEKYFLILWGASANLIANMLHLQMNPENAQTYFKSLPVASFRRTFRPNINESVQGTTMDPWFEKALPEIKNLNGRHLVILRPLMLGVTMNQVAPFLVEYLCRQGFSKQIHFEFTMGYKGFIRLLNNLPLWMQNPNIASFSFTVNNTFGSELPYRGDNEAAVTANAGPYKNIEASELSSATDATQPNPRFFEAQAKLKALFMIEENQNSNLVPW